MSDYPKTPAAESTESVDPDTWWQSSRWPNHPGYRAADDERLHTPFFNKTRHGEFVLVIHQTERPYPRGYWVAVDGTGRKHVPWRFEAYVTRKGGPNVAMVVEPRASRLAIVQIAFSYAGGGGPHDGILGIDLRLPIDHYARRAAAAVTITGSVERETGNWVGHYPHEAKQREAIRIELNENAEALDRVVTFKRREITRSHLREVAALCQAELQRAAAAEKGKGRRARCVPVIMERYDVSSATASRWIRRAREPDYLSKDRPAG
jgi:hypothetical protein